MSYRSQLTVLISFCVLQRAALVERGGRGRKARKADPKAIKGYSSYSSTRTNPVQHGLKDHKQLQACHLHICLRVASGGLLPSQHKQQLGILSMLTEASQRQLPFFLPSNPFNIQSREVSPDIP